MRAGKLRHRVTIQEPIITQNDYYETVETWQDFAMCDASIGPLTAREFFNAAQVQSDVTHKVEIRYVPGVTSAMRLLFGSRVLNILAVLSADERGTSQELLCKEAV